jgi:predicted permease
METLWQDLRYALRILAKNPGLTLVIVASLALGIGANSAIFSIVNGLLLRPLPVEEPSRLVALASSDSHDVYPHGISYPDFLDYRSHSEALADLMVYAPGPFSLSQGGPSERIWGVLASGNYFSLLGVKPAYGRGFLPEDDRAPGVSPVVVISYSLWQRRFGADPGAIGKTVQINGHPFVLVGVAPRGFHGTEVLFASDLWVPTMMEAQIFPSSPEMLQQRDEHEFRAWARLRPGVTREQAQAAISAQAAQLEKAYPITNKNVHILVFPEWEARFEPGSGKGLAVASGMLLAVVCIVLLIACANVANLLLARGSVRTREFAIRRALGASRWRLVRQLLAESMMLALLGGAAGLLVAQWSAGALSSFRPPTDIPFLFDFQVDVRVLVYTLCMGVLAGIAFGLAPALRLSRPDLVPALKDSSATEKHGQRRVGLRGTLVVFQVSASLVLLICAGLFYRSLRHAGDMETGFRNQSVLLFSLSPRQQGYDETQGREFFHRFLEKAAALPGVKSASLVDPPPLDFFSRASDLFLEGYQPRPEEGRVSVSYSRVTPGYFQTVGTSLLRGRDFTARDDLNAPPVVIINETMARRYWPGQDPLGKRLRIDKPDAPFAEIVGVVKDGKYRNLAEQPTPYLFLSAEQHYRGEASFAVLTSGDPHALVAPLQEVVNGLDPGIPIFSVKSVTEHLNGRSLLPFRLASRMLGILGGLGMLLANVGLYGLLSFSVRQHTREIGIRMAIGARQEHILRQFVWQGLKLTLGGLAIGVVLALGATRLVSSILFGVSPTDAATFVTIPLLLLLVALTACYFPARRAARVDPLVALRYE